MTLDNRVREPAHRSPWREPMVWLIAAIPAVAVVAGITLVVVAGRSGGTDAVADRVQRTAQVQVADLGPDALARQLKLSAIVRSDKGALEVLPVQGGFDREAALQLVLRHPTRAALDRTVALQPTRNGWRADAALDLSHDWNAELHGDDGRWRLRARWPAGQQAAYLQPALERD